VGDDNVGIIFPVRVAVAAILDSAALSHLVTASAATAADSARAHRPAHSIHLRLPVRAYLRRFGWRPGLKVFQRALRNSEDRFRQRLDELVKSRTVWHRTIVMLVLLLNSRRTLVHQPSRAMPRGRARCQVVRESAARELL
jgi:hypothetical protein